MKKLLFAVPIVLFSGILFIVFYYHFDPALLAKLSFYIDLANPSMRIVRVNEGLRKEQIADVLMNKLDWGEKERQEFINLTNVEGHYFPETYLIYKDETPVTVTKNMQAQFSAAVSKINKPKSSRVISEDTALKIASIIQRESGGRSDMRLISGIIWNRIFSGMKLQIDATLQYAKGNEEDGWWQDVKSADKVIRSPYNTYLYPGLPPSPISNPGLAAIEAAYNPEKTSCLFYLHDKNHNIHCAKTYAQHEKNIEIYLK